MARQKPMEEGLQSGRPSLELDMAIQLEKIYAISKTIAGIQKLASGEDLCSSKLLFLKRYK